MIPPKSISISEAKEALLRSGYLLEHRLEKSLRRKGWYVQTNDAYLDRETNKSRELDIYALRAEQLGQSLEEGLVWSVLLIECINNSQPLAFITKQPELPELHSEEVKLAGLPAKIVIDAENDAWHPLPTFLKMGEYHHYCTGRIATQFCSFSRKKSGSEWMALHEDIHFDAFRTLTTALEYVSDKFFGDWEFNRGIEFVNVEFYYPVLVLQGSLIEVRSTGKKLTLKEVSHIQYRRSSISDGQDRDYQIDVVTERQFSKYLLQVEKELAETRNRMRDSSRTELIKHSLDTIVDRAKDLQTSKEKRIAMGYKWRGMSLME